MEHIYNYLTLSVEAESDKEVALANWLEHSHYIYAIDHERNAILLFNIPQWLIAHLTEKFCISEWRYEENPNPPRHYVKLFRFIDWHIFENISAYRWFAQKENFRAFSTNAERFDLLHFAFFHDGYSAWRLRYYLSRRLMGLDAKNPRKSFSFDDDREEVALIRRAVLPQLVEAEKKLEVPSTFRYPIDLDIWLDENRLFIGWFVNDLYLYSFRGLFEKMGIVTKEMNPWFEKNCYPRNTRDQSKIDRFLARLRQNNLKDFLCLEIQAAGTTGTPYPYVKELLQTGHYSGKRYTYGINWANEFSKTMMQQAYKKGKIVEFWKRKIVFVVQNLAMDYIQATSDCSKLEDSNPTLPVDFCSFRLQWNNNQWGLEFDNIKSTSIEGVNLILGGANVNEYPTEEEFIRNIIKKGLADGVFVINSRIKRFLGE